jgi:hypothetical protein
LELFVDLGRVRRGRWREAWGEGGREKEGEGERRKEKEGEGGRRREKEGEGGRRREKRRNLRLGWRFGIVRRPEEG